MKFVLWILGIWVVLAILVAGLWAFVAAGFKSGRFDLGRLAGPERFRDGDD